MCHTTTTMAASPTLVPKPLNPKAQSFTPSTIGPKSGPHQRCTQTEPPRAPSPARMYSYMPYYCSHQASNQVMTYQYSSNLYPDGGYLGPQPTPCFGGNPVSRKFRKGLLNNKRIILRRYNYVPPRLRDNNVVRPRLRANNIRKWQNNETQKFRGKVSSGLQGTQKNRNSNEPLIVTAPPRAPPQSVVYSPDDVDEGSNCQKTSVMIRNIPNQYSRNELLEFLDKYCREYNLEYDFAYLPMDFGRHNNLGYAFVNFTTPVAARRVHKLLGGYKWGRVLTGPVKSKKICQITWAKFQGKDALVGIFKNSKFLCYTEEYLPVELSPPSDGTTSTVSKLTTVGSVLRSY